MALARRRYSAGVRTALRHPLDFLSGRTYGVRLAGGGAAWQRASFGTKRPGVQISPPRPSKPQVNHYLVTCGSRSPFFLVSDLGVRPAICWQITKPTIPMTARMSSQDTYTLHDSPLNDRAGP